LHISFVIVLIAVATAYLCVCLSGELAEEKGIQQEQEEQQDPNQRTHQRNCNSRNGNGTALNRALFAFACISHASGSQKMAKDSGSGSRRRQMCVICMENRFSPRATFHAGRPPPPPPSRLSSLSPRHKFRMQRNNSFAYKWISSAHLDVPTWLGYGRFWFQPAPGWQSTHCIFVYLLPRRR